MQTKLASNPYLPASDSWPSVGTELCIIEPACLINLINHCPSGPQAQPPHRAYGCCRCSLTHLSYPQTAKRTWSDFRENSRHYQPLWKWIHLEQKQNPHHLTQLSNNELNRYPGCTGIDIELAATTQGFCSWDCKTTSIPNLSPTPSQLEQLGTS